MEEGVSLVGRALGLIHAGQAPTRSALTAALGVSRATAGSVTGRLRELGLIEVEAGPGGGAHGRPSHRLLIDPGGPAVIAAQVHPDGYEVALVGLGGRVITAERTHAAVPAAPSGALEPLAADAARLLRESGRRCAGAALAVPSAVTVPGGAAVGALYLGWPAGAPVRDLFARHLEAREVSVPYCVAVNDINAAGLAEHRHGAGAEASVLLMVATGHRGVGGALVLDGTLFAGSGGLGMEAGHVSVDPAGRPCPCGNRGCLSVETDAESFLAASGREPAPGSPVMDQAIAVLRHSRASDPAVRSAAASLAGYLGLGLAGLVNVLNPDRILLGGLHRYLLECEPTLLRETIAGRSPWNRGAEVPVQAATLDHATLIGAAELAWQPVLDDPETIAV